MSLPGGGKTLTATGREVTAEEGSGVAEGLDFVTNDEPISEQKIYTSEAGGGMASLRELADFGFGNTTKTEEDEEGEV